MYKQKFPYRTIEKEKCKQKLCTKKDVNRLHKLNSFLLYAVCNMYSMVYV